MFLKKIKNKMLPKYAHSIPQNLLKYVNKKFVRHLMFKVWNICSLRKKKTLLA